MLLASVATESSAQISVTGGDILALRGKSELVGERSDPDEMIAVNVGSAGANQTWDFSSLAADEYQYTRFYLEPSATPYGSQFPDANFAYTAEIQEDTVTFSTFQYFFVDNSILTDVGNVFTFGDSTFVDFIQNGFEVDLPLEMGGGWTDLSRDTTGFDTFEIISTDSSVVTVDAWGTATMPFGTINVLRLKTDSYYISRTYNNGVLLNTMEDRDISYDWLSKEHFIVASISGPSGGTDPNFTSASYIQILQGTNTAVEPDGSGDSGAMLAQLYPNPFSSELTITATVSGTESADLAVYDLLGRRVRSLPIGRTDGAQTITWDGTTDEGVDCAPGLYFVRVKSGQQVETRKVVLSR